MSFALRLKALRKSHGLSRVILSKKLLLSPSSVSKYETGDRTPDIHTLKKLAAFFNVSTDYLLGMGTYCKEYELNGNCISLLKEKAIVYKPTDEEYKLLSDVRSLSLDQQRVINRQINIFMDFNLRMNTEPSIVKPRSKMYTGIFPR